MKPKTLILGSGIAGYSAAQAIKRTDPGERITLITKEPEPTYSACVFAEYIAGEIPRGPFPASSYSLESVCGPRSGSW